MDYGKQNRKLTKQQKFPNYSIHNLNKNQIKNYVI